MIGADTGLDRLRLHEQDTEFVSTTSNPTVGS